MNFFIFVFKGFLLGCTAIVPGISIGTMALVLGVYVKTIDYFTVFFSPKRWNKSTIISMFRYFLPLCIGLLIAMVLFATIMSWLLDNHPAFVRLFFIGIIIGSIPYIYTTHLKDSMKMSISLYILIGMIVVILFSFSKMFFSPEATQVEEIALQVSFSAMISALIFGLIGAACGIIPGISGSFVLLILGYYPRYLAIIKTITLPLFIPLLIGSGLGFIVMSLLLKYLFQSYSLQSYGVILGLTMGSIIGIFPWKQVLGSSIQIDTQLAINILIALVCIVGGIAVSIISAKSQNYVKRDSSVL